MTRTVTNAPPAPNSTPLAELGQVWLDGQLVPGEQAAISVMDHGVLYGDGVFEGIRVYNGRIFKLGQHLDRLYDCASRIRLDLAAHCSRDQMTQILRRTVAANELVNGYIRLVVTRGDGTLGLNPFKCPEPGIICIADQIALYPPELYETGMRVVVANRRRIGRDALDPRIKSLNYLNNILAKVEAIDHGCLEVIMLSPEGAVGECSGDNIFLVKNGELHTPRVEDGILEGITRRFVMAELAPKAGIAVHERRITLDEVLEADEVFLTGSAAEMIAVTQVDTQTPDGKIEKAYPISDGEGPVTAKLRGMFTDVVTSDDVPED